MSKKSLLLAFAIGAAAACTSQQRGAAHESGLRGRFVDLSYSYDEGTLFWPTAESEQPSPLGALAASASEQGYQRSQTGKPNPFYGYYFRMLKAQGPSASGGARSYVINGKLIGGFGVVAFPAEYGNSGVMTFIVLSRPSVRELFDAHP